MNIPEISVIISVHNHEKWIERCLRSLLSQIEVKTSDYEIIIIDDCSKDSSPLIIEKFNKKFENIKFLKNKNNLGLQKSINKAITSSNGRYIVRVDSDDYVSKNFLFFMKFFLDKNRHYQAVAVDYNKIDEDEKILDRIDASKEEIACGIMFRRDSLISLGLYNEKFNMREGHELKKRFLKIYKIGYLELPLYNYRMHISNRTKDLDLVKKFDKKLSEI